MVPTSSKIRIILYLDCMKVMAVFCGSSPGLNGIYREQAALLGKTLAERKIHLIYGGGKVGLMGVLADAALGAGGKVTGIIPEFLNIREVVHTGLTELIRVETMHRRKALIQEMSDGAIALPGGFGTMDEMFEMLTWSQLGLHEKPVGLLNVNGYFTTLLRFGDHMVREGFLKGVNLEMLLVSAEVETLLSMMEGYEAPRDLKWI